MKILSPNIIVLFIYFLIVVQHIQAESSASPKSVVAIAVNGNPPRIDGKLDEAQWHSEFYMSGFVQKDPMEGKPASNDVNIRFLYDDKALYIGARMYKDSPEDITATVTRRDNTGNSERIILSIDSYNDDRTAYTYGLTASGVKFDYYHASDREGDRDYSFNPVWEGKTNIDSNGWTAEIRIPFSQLRFNDLDNQIWGINVNWWVPKLQEDSYWILVPKSETGWSSRMGDLKGISGIKPSNRIEFLPYIASRGKYNPNFDHANPYDEEFDFDGRAGLDFKMGLGPNLTLDATINPDFGQVEADPAVVNLTAYETFFAEKRPFFTEGRKLIQGAGPNYFYSRRIGGRPAGSPETGILDYYSSIPNNTGILGAAKISGRTKSGMSIGGLGALTSNEYADLTFYGFDENDPERDSSERVMVEPLTAYGVARVQQEFGKNTSTAGLMLTGVHRYMDEGSYLNDQLVKDAITGGGDWNVRYNKGEYVFGGHFGFSSISGSKEAILIAQQRPARYFQRPDADYIDLDSNATSMTGLVGSIRFNKNTGEHWLWGASFSFETPFLELNDLGQMHSADDIDYYARLTYRDIEPGDIFHAYSFNLSIFHKMNFGMENLQNGFSLNTNYTFLDRSSAHINIWHDFEGYDDGLTRGGPLMGIYSLSGVNAGYSSDWTKNTAWNANAGYSHSPSGAYSFNINARLNVRTGGRLEFSIKPKFSRTVSRRQYITTLEGGNESTYNQRYIFSSIERNTISTVFRLNYAFTNDLTLEYYAEPFVTSGIYYDFGELEKARGRTLKLYDENGTTIDEIDKYNYEVKEGDDTFTINYGGNFNALSFRSNLVLRWEWSPGSSFFLVWQQNRWNWKDSREAAKFSSLFDTLTADGINTFALKFSYWIPAE